MSHKGKNSAISGKGKKPKSGGESKSEDVLQAVVGGMAGRRSLSHRQLTVLL